MSNGKRGDLLPHLPLKEIQSTPPSNTKAKCHPEPMRGYNTNRDKGNISLEGGGGVRYQPAHEFLVGWDNILVFCVCV